MRLWAIQQYDGLELGCTGWRIEPLIVGAAEFDSALLLRGLPARWEARPGLSLDTPQGSSTVWGFVDPAAAPSVGRTARVVKVVIAGELVDRRPPPIDIDLLTLVTRG
jgi:hypothetical protein